MNNQIITLLTACLLSLVILSCTTEDGTPTGDYRIDMDQQSIVLGGKTYTVDILEAQELPLSPKRFFAIGVDYSDYRLSFDQNSGCLLSTAHFGEHTLNNNTTTVIYNKTLHTLSKPIDDPSFEAAFLKLIEK